MCQLADADQRNILEWWTDSRSTAHKKLQTQNDADAVPSILLARVLYFFGNC